MRGRARKPIPLRHRVGGGFAAVDEQPGAIGRRHGDALHSLLAGLRMTTVEGADSDGEHEVVWLFVGLQDEIFDRNVTQAYAARGDLVGRGGARVRDGRGGQGRWQGCGR